MSAVAALAAGALLALAVAAAVPASSQAAPVQSLLAPIHVCPKQNATGARLRVQERAMRCLINQARKRSGLHRLAPSYRLTVSARLKSRDIRSCRSFSHYACGRDFTFWIKRTGYTGRCWSAAENIAWGSGRDGSPRRILAAWLRSPAHRDSILSSSYSDLGAGVRRTGGRGSGRTQTWTAHLGRRC